MISFRAAVPEDANRLLEIYAPYVKTTAITFEYEVPSLEEFQNRISTISQRFPYIVAIKDDVIVGYAYAGVFHARKAYEHSCELSIYVDSTLHHQGVGSALYDELEKRLLEKDITVLYACIAATSRNPDKYLTGASQLFHKARGFRFAGKFKCCAYKFNNWYDMVYMEKHLTKKDFSDPNSTAEVYDLFTQDHHPTGLTKLRGEIPPAGLKQQVIHVAIFNSEGQLLIQQRTSEKKWGNLWDITIGGHVTTGETPGQGATRELLEELGISLDLSEAQSHFTVNFEKGFDDFFVIQKDVDLGGLKLQASEVKAVKWESVENIKKMIADGTFIPYKLSLIDFLKDMSGSRGAHNL